MKTASVYVALAGVLCAYPALVFGQVTLTPPDITRCDDGTVRIEFCGNPLAHVSWAVGRAFGVRVCAEDFGIVDPASTGVVARDPGSGGPLLKQDQPQFSGKYTAATVEEMLDALTGPSPYTWQKNNACYVIYPRTGSLLMEKVTVSIPACSLYDAVSMVFASRSDSTKKDEPMGIVQIGSGPPRPSPQKVDVTALTFVDTPLMDALCRAVEAAGTDGAGLFVWYLCGGWAHEMRCIHLEFEELGVPQSSKK
jgi:hypothetical protein